MTKNRVWRRLTASAAALLALAVAPGCGVIAIGLPTSGSVTQLPVAPQERKHVFTAPQGPRAGATPETIVQGFFDALPAGPQSDAFTVAKQFLTTDARDTWDPDTGTLVAAAEPEYSREAGAASGTLTSQVAKAQMAVSFKASGTLDAHGLFTAKDATATTTQHFALTQVEGEWRISKLPNGIVIRADDFAQVFREVTLYQVDTQKRTFIPDVRWFGWRQWRTLAVRELLRGPAAWMGDAALTDAYSKINLEVSSVPLVEGKVKVLLTSNVMELPVETRSILVRQIRLTLGDGNTGYDLSIRDEAADDLSTADQGLSLKVDVPTRRIYSLSNNALVLLQSSNLLRIGETSDRGEPMAMAYSSQGGAIQNADLTVSCIEAEGKDCGSDFAGAKVRALAEGFGSEVWAARLSPRATFLVRDGEKTTEMAVPWIGDAQVVAMTPSPEGSRLAVALRSRDRTVIYLVGIERDDNEQVVGLSNTALPIAYVGDVTGMAFYDDITLVYAGSGGEKGSRQMAPGLPTIQNVPEGTIALAGGVIDSTQGLAALDKSGIVRTLTGSLTTSWVITDSQSSAISSGE